MTKQIIKEIRLSHMKANPNDPNGEPWLVPARCVIRSNYYGSFLDTFKKYADIARETYPTLEDRDIEIVHFGGIRYKSTFGIEFTPPDNPTAVPDGWTEIKELEQLL